MASWKALAFKQTFLLVIFIRPAFDLHLLTYFPDLELHVDLFSLKMCHVWSTLKTHQHVSRRGKAPGNWWAPRRCSIATKYSTGAFSSNFSAKRCSLGVFCPTWKRNCREIWITALIPLISSDLTTALMHKQPSTFFMRCQETGIAARSAKQELNGKCKMMTDGVKSSRAVTHLD